MTAPRPTSESPQRNPLLQPVHLVAQREDYVTCHITIPDESERLPAIALGQQFYSFLRLLPDPVKTIGLLLKLSARGELVAVTLAKQGYALWVHEADGRLANKKMAKRVLSSSQPANCWIIGGRQAGYRLCSLRVSDLPDTLPGIVRDNNRLYSLYRREYDASKLLKIASRLIQRGDEVVIVVGKSQYALCIHEPEATVIES